MPKPVLGRGLGALLGGVPASVNPESSDSISPEDQEQEVPSPAVLGESIRRVALQQIRPCPFQPRREFGRESLKELADSIKEQGILQPLIVRQQGDHYELIAGERRWRAAQLLELHEVPVIVRAANDHEVLELALIENLQRDNLNPLEEAMGYARLIAEFQLRQEDVAEKVGKSRASVANALRLLKLPDPIQSYIQDGQISVGHAKAILGLPDSEQQQLAAHSILKDGLNVRQAEALVNRLQHSSSAASAKQSKKSAPTAPHHTEVENLENRIRERFGTRVHLHYREGKGYVQIRFFNHEDLDRVLRLAGVSLD